MSEVWKPIAAVFFVLGVVIALGYAAIYGFGTMQKDTAGFRGGVGESERVKADPDYRIAQKRYFHDLCGDIAAKQDVIEGYEQDIKIADEDGERDRLQQAISANRTELQTMAEDYNAASDDPNRGVYRAESLPEHIDPDEEVTCATAS